MMVILLAMTDETQDAALKVDIVVRVDQTVLKIRALICEEMENAL